MPPPAWVALVLALVAPAVTTAVEDGGTPAGLVRLFEANQYPEVLAKAPGVPRSLERDGVWLAAMAIVKGADSAIAFSSTLGVPADERRRALFGASLRCLAARRYEPGRALFSAGVTDTPPTDSAGLRKLQEKYGPALASLFSGLRRREDLSIPPSDPRAPVIQFLALVRGVSVDASHVFARELGSVPVPPTHRPSLPVPNAELLGLKDFVLPAEAELDMFIAGLDFSTRGEPESGWYMRVVHTLSGGEFRFFLIREGEEARVLAAELPASPGLMLSYVARHVGDQVAAGDLPRARQWIGWVRECLATSGDARWSSFLAASTPDALASAEGVRTAAGTLATTTTLSGGLVGRASVSPATSRPGSAPGIPAFGAGMTRPVMRSSPNGKAAPDWPNGASTHGLIIVKCILTVEARPIDCVVVKSLSPLVDEALVHWLQGCMYEPATFQGNPVQVSYVFNFKLTAPATLVPDAGRP